MKMEREELFCRHSVWTDFRSSMFLCRLFFFFFGEVSHFTERSGFLELCVICEKLIVYRVVIYDIGERCRALDEENGPQYWALKHTVHELWWWRRRIIDWSGQLSVWEVWLKPLECSKLSGKNRVQAGEENLVVSSVKSGRKIQQKKNRNVVIVQSGEDIVYNAQQNGLGAVSCSIGWLKGVADVVFLWMGEKFVENDFFKDFGQKWKVRNGR